MINLKALLTTILILSLLGIISFFNINIDADITGSLPKKDPVLSDAAYVLRHHPMQDLVVIEIHQQKNDINALVEAGNVVQKELRESSLFETVGMESFENRIPEIMVHVSKNLPVLFTEKELVRTIEPLLTPEHIKKTLKRNYIGLQDINRIGIAKILSHDPLGLSDPILAKLLYLSPSNRADFHKGHLISKDGKHLLIIATPESSGTDTDFAKKITALMRKTAVKLNKTVQDKELIFSINPIGSYRYALDNETIAKKDTKRAILFATLGIALMLIFVFPRPLIGLFSFLPAIAGTVVSFFIYSLFHEKISILALGFGGAIISITVDHGVAYLLFLDQQYEMQGKEAAREVWSAGLLATLTTVFAFLSLFIGGFPILTQVGQFAAFGILFSFIFVHTVFPLIFPHMPPAKRKKPSIVQQFTNQLALSHKKAKLIVAVALFGILIIFAKPVFRVDLSSLNTVGKETSRIEEHIRQTWGNIPDKIFMVAEGETLEKLQIVADKITVALEEDKSHNRLAPSFVSSMIFPGIKRSNKNFTAWKNFWTKKRKKHLKKHIQRSAEALGFSASAFEPFFAQIDTESFTITPIPEKLYPLFGIEKIKKFKDNRTRYRHFYTLTPGKNYHAESFFAKYHPLGNIKIFDQNYFSKKLGRHLTSAFIRMFVIIFCSLTIFLLLFFVDLKLTVTSLTPVVFAFCCTLGTLKLLSHPIGIPGLMISIVVLGMGIDYSLYFVRSHQRYLTDTHPSFSTIRTAVFLAAASTLIGFGVMCFANHSLLRNAGVTSFFGIFFSLMGAFFILPAVLSRLFHVDKKQFKRSKFSYEPVPKNILKYYKHMEGLVRIYVRMKLRFDPMYKELDALLSSPKKFIDMGCGYGVTSVWILDRFPASTAFGVESNAERARIAKNAFKHRGTAVYGKAPNLPELPDNVDTALMIDVAHYMNDNDLEYTLKMIYAALNAGGILLMRETIPKKNKFSFLRWIEKTRLKLSGVECRFRSMDKLTSIISNAGFHHIITEKSKKNREEVWFSASVNKR